MTSLILSEWKGSGVGAGFCCMYKLHVVGAGFGDQIRGVQETFKSSSVSPPAVQFIPGHFSARDVGVVHVGYFQLAAAGRLECPNDIEDCAVVHVDPDHGEF